MLALLVGCTINQSDDDQLEISGTYTLNYFFVEGCSRCDDFIDYAIPAIEEEFGDHIIINTYSLDDLNNKDIYDDTIARLDGYEDENYGYGPFISLDGYFAKLGFSYGDEDELISDMKKAINGKELGDELVAGRYYFIAQ